METSLVIFLKINNLCINRGGKEYKIQSGASASALKAWKKKSEWK